MNRKTNIDLLRIFSAFAVVVIHIVSASITYSETSVEQSLLRNTSLIRIFMSWSVPMFFIITGYCISLKQTYAYKHCFKRIIKYTYALFTVGFAYALLEQIFNARRIDIAVVAASFLNIITGNLWDHMWYIYDIIGVYLVMPVIYKFAKDNSKEFSILTVILFVFTIILPTFRHIFPVGFTIPFGGYLFYVCFGFLIANVRISKLRLSISALLVIPAVIWIVLGRDNWIFGYNSLAICVIAVFIFSLFCKMDIKENKFILFLSSTTWGIYLSHPLFINIIVKVFNIDIVSSYPYLNMTLFSVAIFATAFLFTYIMRKIPLIKKLF